MKNNRINKVNCWLIAVIIIVASVFHTSLVEAQDCIPSDEICDGIDNDCDGEIDEGGGALCDDGNPCTADSCNGTSGCLSDPVPMNGDVCREAAGDCDIAETCQGGECPADVFEAVGTACGDSTDDVCTNPNTCDGNGVCQDNHEPTTTVCRDDAGECDVAEYCDGAGNCPADVYQQDDTPCDNDTVCDGREVCTAGKCVLVSGTIPQCDDDGDICNGGESCDPIEGCISTNPLPDGESCDDGDACTIGETCSAGVCGGGTVPNEICDGVGVIVPAYFYPTSSCEVSSDNYWDDMADAASQIPIIAIMNPNSGPGDSQNSDYECAINKLRIAGGKIIGYVHTSYGSRSIEDCEDEIDKYYDWYNVDGVFFDEMSHDSGKFNYYKALYDYVVCKGGIVVGNPGTNTDEDYMDASTILNIFEGTGDDYPGWSPASWTENYPPSSFSNMIHEVSDSSKVEEYIDLARSRNIGWIYITDDVMPNPWDTLPSYWDQFIELCKGRDNNCNGEINEGFDFGKSCTVGEGSCQAAGFIMCSADGLSTNCGAVEEGPRCEEICDDLDNDCDGNIDEKCDDDNDDYCDASMVVIGTPNVCSNGGGDCDDNPITGPDVNPGVQESISAGNCDDGRDNDCDGKTDDEDDECKLFPECDPGSTRSCRSGQPGECAVGTETCNELGTWGECVAPEPCIEVCGDGLDNDCDGETDEAGCNHPPDCSNALPTISCIWSPNHKMVDVGVEGITDPDGDHVTLTITGITQDEPVNGSGDGNTHPDGDGVGTGTARVRAERAGSGNGRVYEISFTAADGRCGECNGSVQVCVPHDQGKKSWCDDDKGKKRECDDDKGENCSCVDDGQDYISTGWYKIDVDIDMSKDPIEICFTPEVNLNADPFITLVKGNGTLDPPSGSAVSPVSGYCSVSSYCVEYTSTDDDEEVEIWFEEDADHPVYQGFLGFQVAYFEVDPDHDHATSFCVYPVTRCRGFMPGERCDKDDVTFDMDVDDLDLSDAKDEHGNPLSDIDCIPVRIVDVDTGSISRKFPHKKVTKLYDINLYGGVTIAHGKHVKVTMSFELTEGSKKDFDKGKKVFEVYYYDEVTGNWESKGIRIVDVQWDSDTSGAVSFTTPHLTTFAVSAKGVSNDSSADTGSASAGGGCSLTSTGDKMFTGSAIANILILVLPLIVFGISRKRK